MFSLFYFITHSSYKFSPIEKEKREGIIAWTIPPVKSGGPGVKPPEAPWVYIIFSAKYHLNLLYFNTFFLQIFTHRKKKGGGDNYMGHPPCQKVEWIYPIPLGFPPLISMIHKIRFYKCVFEHLCVTVMVKFQWRSQRGVGGWLPPWQKLCPPLLPPNEITLCTEVYGEPPFWVPVSPPLLTPQPPLPPPHFEKSGYAHCHQLCFKVKVFHTRVLSQSFHWFLVNGIKSSNILTNLCKWPLL